VKEMEGGVALAGAMEPGGVELPGGVEMKVDHLKVRELVFVQGTAVRARMGEEVGRYRIEYGDGSEEEVKLVYGENIRATDDLEPTVGAVVGWVERNGEKGAARVMRYQLKETGKEVVGIGFSTGHAYASPVLYGVTGVE
jgi:hypothetical protein